MLAKFYFINKPEVWCHVPVILATQKSWMIVVLGWLWLYPKTKLKSKTWLEM
jgi:hypothetical protein